MSRGPTKMQILGAVLKGLGIVAILFVVLHKGVTYSAPAKVLPVAASVRPFVEGGYIKAPFDIERTKECLNQSTATITRLHDYGPDLGGVREDKVVIGLSNTTISGLGIHKMMLWFPVPQGVGGFWDVEAKAQDDCGGMLDLTNDHPRNAGYKHLYLGPEPNP